MQTQRLKANITFDIKGLINKYAVVIALLVLWGVFAIFNPNFLTFNNIHAIILNAVPVGIVAIGAGIGQMGGYYDMSVGMVGGMAIVLVPFLFEWGFPIWAIILIPLLMGALCGFITGCTITYLNMNSWISTFALQKIYQTILYVVTDGVPITLGSAKFESFTKFGSMRIWGIQFPIIVMIVVYILAYLFLRFRPMGRYMYLLGSNSAAAQISGVNLHKTRLTMFIIQGTLAALGGLLWAARLKQAAPFVCQGFPFEGIAAAMVAGMYGGKGNILLCLVALLLIYTIKNGLVQIGLSEYFQYAVIGLLMLYACILQTGRKK